MGSFCPVWNSEPPRAWCLFSAGAFWGLTEAHTWGFSALLSASLLLSLPLPCLTSLLDWNFGSFGAGNCQAHSSGHHVLLASSNFQVSEELSYVDLRAGRPTLESRPLRLGDRAGEAVCREKAEVTPGHPTALTCMHSRFVNTCSLESVAMAVLENGFLGFD